MLLLCVIGVLGWSVVAFAAKWRTAYTPGPLAEVHAAFGCESCHAGFARVADTSCQTCHPATAVRAIHTQNKASCVSCHSEHLGAKFDIARNIGSGCQAAGCHVTVHETEKKFLAARTAPEPGLVVPSAVALAAHFEAGDAIHDKHANLKAACAACHTDGDPSRLDRAQPASYSHSGVKGHPPEVPRLPRIWTGSLAARPLL